MGFSLDEYAKKRRGSGDPSASLRLEAEALGRTAGVEAAPRKAGGGFSLDEYHRQRTGGAKSQTLGNLPRTTTPEAGEKSVKRLDQKTVAAPTAPMGLADLQAEKRWVAGELEKGRKRREAVTAQPASAQKAPMGLAAIKELDRSLQARRDYGVYKATGETPDDPGQIRGMQRLAQKELEEAREKERKAGAAYQAKTGPASTYGGQGRVGLEPVPTTEYGGRGQSPAPTTRKELGELLAAQRERVEAKGRTLDLPEVYGAAVRQKKWDAMPTDLGELKARKETVTAERDEAGKEMRRLWAERYALGEDPARAAERAELTAQYDAAAATYKEKDLELTRLGQRQYDQRNVQAFGRMSGDEDMVELFQSAREIQSDMDQLLAYMTNSRRGGAETPAARQFVDRVKEKYGITASGQGELQRVYGQLSQRLNAASGQLSEEGYDFRDMDVYAGREEKAREQARRNEQTAQFAEEHPVIASAASGVASLAQWADLGNMDWGRGKPGDPDYIPPDTSAMGIVSYVQTVRGTVGRKIETQTDAELFGRNVGSFLYQTGMSMADSGLSIATLGPGSIYLMGANAAVNTSKEIVDRGGTSSQAFWGGLAAGAAEMLFEKVSVDRLLTPKSVADWKGVVRELLTQGGVEASEEVCTEIANILSDTAIMGANSNFANAVRDYQAQGMTAEQAKRRAYLDQLGQVVEAGLGGFVSGVGMAGGKVAVDYAGQRAGRVSGPYEGQQKTASVGESGKNKLLTEQDLKEYLAVGERKHVRDLKAAQVRTGDSPILTTLGQIKSFIRSALAGETRDAIKGYGKVGTRMMEDLRAAGVDVDGYYLELDANRLGHLSDHIGDDGDPRNVPLTQEQAENLTSCIDDYDDVLDVVRHKDGGVRITLGKRINGHAVVVELVSKGRRSIQPVTAWQNDTEHYLRKYGQKGTQAIDTSRSRKGEESGYKQPVSTNSIPQAIPGVKKDQARQAREAEVLRGIPLTKSLGAAGRTGLTNAIETRLAQGSFTGELNPLTLAEGYQEVYLAGLSGVELEPGGVPLMAGHNAELLSPTERLQAYSNGVNDAKARVELNKRRAKFATVAGTEKGLVWDAEGWVEHHLDAQVADRINETAKRLGVRVAFADSLAGGLANGQIVEADIRISKDADQPWMVVFGHEVGHWLEETAPEAYQTLRKFTSQRRMAEIEGMMELYDRAGRELSFDDALKELVNDDIGRMIAEPQILQSFIEANKNDRTLLQKVADAFRALWQRLTGKDRQQVKTAEEALLAALKASEAQAAKLERAGQVMDFDQGQGAEGGEYSIKYDVNNTPFVTVEEDILAGVPEEEWLPTVRSVLQERFPDGVTVARSHIKINAVTTGELTRSGYTRWLRDSTPDIYADKFRAAANMDEVLLAARDYVGEGLKHPRKDNIKEFARGTVQLRVGKNDYIADVVVGTTAGGKLVLYDLVNILPTTITEKKQSQAGPSSTNGTQPRTPEIASETTVTHPTEDVNGDLSLKGATAVGEEVVRLEEQGRQEGWSREQLQGEIRAAVSQVLEDLAKEYGTIKPGENPVREVAVPRKTAKDEKVSQTVRTILEAGATPEAAIPSIEELTAKGEFSYEALSDKTAIERAEQSINHKGWGASLAEWYETVRSGKVSKDNTAVGWALYNHAVNGGDIQTAMDILQSMVRHQRNAAQAVQATRILKQLAPEAQLYGVQRSVESLQEELNERFGDGKGPQLVIDQELAERLMEAQDQEERDVVLRDIYRDIGRQMPSTFLDRWNAWRYLSMLGNPRTHVRNIVGNAGFAPVVLAKDMTATAIERAVYAVSGGRLERSKGLVGLGKQGRGLLAAAWGDYAHVKDAALGGGKYGEFQHANKYIEEGRTVFTSKPGKALEAARRANSTALDAEDAWFSQPHYAYAMAQYCAANGITEDVIRAGDGGALGKAREYAIWEAQKATYRDTNALSQLLGGLGRDLRRSKNAVSRAAGVAVEGILPFRKTPANILARGLEYSPLGLVKSLSYDLAQVRKGNMTGAEAIDNISAGLTGTGLLALGVYLAAQGLLRGKGSGDDKEKELEKLQGHQDYALELGDVSVTLDWLAPEALPLFIGANLWETLQRDGDVTMSGVLEAVSNVSDPLLEMSCLQSLNDVFDSVGYASENELNPLTQGLVSAATSYLTQGLPTIFGQAERVAETRRETTYTSKDAFLTGDMQYFLGKVMNKLPGEFQQIPFVDAWGRTEETGSLGERAFGNFLNPAYVSEIEESGMERELVRLYEATGENVFPGRAKKYVQVNGTRKELTAEEYVDYATRKGRTARKLVTALTRAKGYAGLKDGEKAEAVADTYKYAEQMARKRVAKDYAPDSWVTKARTAEKEYGIPVETYILLRNRTAGLESIKGKDGESIANSKGLQIMEVVYDNTPGMGDKQRGYLFEALGAGKSIQHYNKAKVKEELGRMRK